MEQLKPLTDFFEGIAHDPRIGSTHIALFSAIISLYIQSGYQNPVLTYRARLMPAAKIFGLGTFHKTIRELNEYGYLKYESSFNRKGSKIFLLQINSGARISEDGKEHKAAHRAADNRRGPGCI